MRRTVRTSLACVAAVCLSAVTIQQGSAQAPNTAPSQIQRQLSAGVGNLDDLKEEYWKGAGRQTAAGSGLPWGPAGGAAIDPSKLRGNPLVFGAEGKAKPLRKKGRKWGAHPNTSGAGGRKLSSKASDRIKEQHR